MINAVAISNFRGVREGSVEGLSPLSILVGPNNAGKSTCLEAIAVVGLGAHADKIAGLMLRRGGPPLDALDQIVHRGANATHIDCRGTVDGKDTEWITAIQIGGPPKVQHMEEVRRQGLRDPVTMFYVASEQNYEAITYVDAEGRQSFTFLSRGTSRKPFPVQLVDVEAVRAGGALEDAYSQIEQAGQVTTVVRALQRSMPGLTDLRILKSGDDFILNAIRGKERPVPIYVAGDGLKRFLALAAAALDQQANGVVLLEEPESFQHPRYLHELATLLLLAAKNGTQVILTTHSIDLIDLLLHAPEAEGLPFPTVHRMRLTEGKLKAVTLSREDALIGRDELLEDLRS